METLFKIIILSYLIYMFIKQTYIGVYKIDESEYKFKNLIKTLKGGI